MAFPTDTFTSADLAVLIPEVWGEKINDFFREELTMASFFTDRSDEVMMGGDILHTPGLTQMSANAKVNAQAVTLNSPTETEILLTIDQWFEVSFAIEDKEAAQVKRSYNLQERYAMNAGFTIAEKLETDIAALAATFTTTVGTNATPITDTEIRGAIAALRQNIKSSYRPQDVAFFFRSVVFYGQVQALDKFSIAINSPVQDPVMKDPEAYLYGVPVFVSENVVDNTVGYDNFLAHKDAVHWATSPVQIATPNAMVGRYGVRVQSNYIPEYLSTVTTADLLYGVVLNRPEAGILMLSQQTSV